MPRQLAELVEGSKRAGNGVEPECSSGL